MEFPPNFLQLGLSQYEITAYLSLVGRHPVNGSQLSRFSGIPRARIYDVLRSLKDDVSEDYRLCYPIGSNNIRNQQPESES